MKNAFRAILPLTFAALLLLLIACAGRPTMLAPEDLSSPDVDLALTILHTNDIHAHFAAFNKHGNTCKPAEHAEGKCFGGAARIVGAIKRIRDERPATLVLDAGDVFQGTLFYSKYKGKAARAFMQAAGYDAMALGNHEFDDGPSVLAEFLKSVSFPVLAANVDVSAEPRLEGLIRPYVVKEVKGRKVGILGIVTESVPVISSPGPTVRFLDVMEATRKSAAELKAKGAEIVIALSHAGLQKDMEIAMLVSGVDVIVGGHSHLLLSNREKGAVGPYPKMVTNPAGEPVLVVQVGSYGKYLGRLDVAFDKAGRPVKWAGEPIRLDQSLPEDPAVLKNFAGMMKEIDEFHHQRVGKTDLFLNGDCRHEECNLGDLICDSIRTATRKEGVQIAFVNGGGIRSSIPTGDITLGQVLETLPFGDTLTTMKIQGKDLLAALEHSVSQAENPENEGTGRFLQVSGIRYEWDARKPAGERLVKAEILNSLGEAKPLRPDVWYRVAMSDFLARGGDGYEMFKANAGDAYNHGKRISGIFAEYLQKLSPVFPRTEGRIVRK